MWNTFEININCDIVVVAALQSLSLHGGIRAELYKLLVIYEIHVDRDSGERDCH